MTLNINTENDTYHIDTQHNDTFNNNAENDTYHFDTNHNDS